MDTYNETLREVAELQVRLRQALLPLVSSYIEELVEHEDSPARYLEEALEVSGRHVLLTYGGPTVALWLPDDDPPRISFCHGDAHGQIDVPGEAHRAAVNIRDYLAEIESYR